MKWCAIVNKMLGGSNSREKIERRESSGALSASQLQQNQIFHKYMYAGVSFAVPLSGVTRLSNQDHNLSLTLNKCCECLNTTITTFVADNSEHFTDTANLSILRLAKLRIQLHTKTFPSLSPSLCILPRLPHYVLCNKAILEACNTRP